jgi:tetratricopeptide (TPR) repeat protein
MFTIIATPAILAMIGFGEVKQRLRIARPFGFTRIHALFVIQVAVWVLVIRRSWAKFSAVAMEESCAKVLTMQEAHMTYVSRSTIATNDFALHIFMVIVTAACYRKWVADVTYLQPWEENKMNQSMKPNAMSSTRRGIRAMLFFSTTTAIFLSACLDRSQPLRDSNRPTIWHGYATPNYDKIRSYADKLEFLWDHPTDSNAFDVAISTGEQLLQDRSIQAQAKDVTLIYRFLHGACLQVSKYSDALEYSNKLINYLSSSADFPEKLVALAASHFDKANVLIDLNDFEEAKREIHYIIESFPDDLPTDPIVSDKRDDITSQSNDNASKWNVAESAVHLLDVLYNKQYVNDIRKNTPDKTNEAIAEFQTIYAKHKGTKIGFTALMNEFNWQIEKGDASSLKELKSRMQEDTFRASDEKQMVSAALKRIDSALKDHETRKQTPKLNARRKK